MDIVNGELHRRSVTGVFQRCVSPDEGREILNEIHSRDCGHHAGSRSLVAKAFRHGFFWLRLMQMLRILCISVMDARSFLVKLMFLLKNFE
jgi:hypothetical protein